MKGIVFTEFIEIHGDRRFADDHAIVAGFARYKGEPVLVVGHQKGGADTKEKIFRNFGYAKPEGYRKALRAMEMAEKFARPIIVFVDTPAAYPGVESEERGIAEAIALNLREMAMIDVPIIVNVCNFAKAADGQPTLLWWLYVRVPRNVRAAYRSMSTRA
mgnify:CR=1 FL=1